MQIAEIRLCASCGHDNSSVAILCSNCGKQVNPDHYKIIREGAKYGVALNGRVVYHDLLLSKAQGLVSILNEDSEQIEAGVA